MASPFRLMTFTTAPAGTDVPDGAWIIVDRERSVTGLAVGPYPSTDDAVRALDSLLLDVLCEEDCTDAYVSTDAPTDDYDLVLVDLDDPDHTGK